MAGLLNQNPTQNLDPKQVEQFKTGYQLAKQFVYQDKIFQGLVQDIQSGNPVNVISGVVVTVMLRIQEETGQLSLPVAAAMGIAMIDDIAQTLEQIQIMENDPQMQAEVFQSATIQWLQSNKYPPEEVASELEAMGAPPEMIQAITQGGGQPQEPPMEQEAPQGAPQGEPMQPQGNPQGLLRRQ